ncbi:hypothetical protein Tco_1235387 [Tanacetum coccineum]
MNQDFYNSNPSGFDQFQPPQFPVNYPPQETNKEILQAREDLMEMDDLQVLKGRQQEKKEMAAQSLIPYWNSSMIDDEEARDNFLKDVCTFLRKFSRIPFGVTPKLHSEDWRNISEEFSEYINCPSWNRPLFYFDDDDDEYTVIWRRPKAITPDKPFEEPEDPLIMREKELSTILKKDKSSVEDLDPIPSGSKGFSDDICDNDHFYAASLLSQDIPITSPKIDFLSKEFAGKLTPIPLGMEEDEFDEEEDNCYDDDTSSDDDSFENINYVEASPPDYELVSLEEVEDVILHDNVILREKLLNISRLITNIESLNDNPTPDYVFKSPSSFPILVTDSDSFFEKSDTSLSYSDNSLLEFETFSDHTEEIRSGSTTTHANNSLPEYDSFLFEFEPDQGELTNVVIEEVNTFLVPEDSIPSGIESNFDPGGGEINVSQNVKDDDSFTFVIRTFLSFLIYPANSPLLLSTGSEDTIFDTSIST